MKKVQIKRIESFPDCCALCQSWMYIKDLRKYFCTDQEIVKDDKNKARIFWNSVCPKFKLWEYYEKLCGKNYGESLEGSDGVPRRVYEDLKQKLELAEWKLKIIKKLHDDKKT